MRHLTFFLFASTVSLMAHTLQSATVYKDIEAGDVTSLTNELAQSRNGNTVVIRLAAGDYDLTGIEMDSGSHLYLDNRAIVGQGDSPWKTRLIGDGTKRIIKATNAWYDGNKNCRVENLTVTNGWTTGNGGGIAGYPNIINTVVIGNHAEGNGGGIGEYGYCHNLIIMNNTAKGVGGGAYNPNYIYNSEIRGNTAQNGGGVGNNGSYGTLTNCIIEGNIAAGYGGGVRRISTIKKCRIVGNEAVYYGGGVEGSDFSGAKYELLDSTICSNTATYTGYGYGAGVYSYAMTNCVVFANYGRYGGGISQCRADNCRFFDNYAIGAGGAVHASTCTKCEIQTNIVGGTGSTGHNAYQSKLFDCDVSATGVSGCIAVRCTFHDIGRAVSIDNPYIVASTTNALICTGIPVCTNCLFVNNRQEWYYTPDEAKSYGQSLFQGVDNASISGQIVNCTVVSNTVGQMFSYCRATSKPWNVENSVFFGNVCYWGNGDLVNYDHNITNGIFFTRCAYGVSSGKFSSAGPSIWTKAGETNYKFGADGFPAKPVFMYERKPGSAYPFSLWYTSPLCGRGKVEDWMSSAYDIRGDADGGKYLRLRDGKCDIGCYQCWEKIPGITISLK